MAELALSVRGVAYRDGALRATVAPASAVRADAFTLVSVAGSEIGIVRSADGFHAVRNWCPHRGAPVCRGWITGTMLPSAPGDLDWGLDGRVLRCPWHRWEFDLHTGQALFDIDRRRLITYAVSEVGDCLEIELGALEERFMRREAADDDQC
jgi:nitrite reductase/ring-hydroxylating ferredoxin subunit